MGYKKLLKQVSNTNKEIESLLWLDMRVFRFENDILIIAGSEDFTYGHDYEFIFEEVFTISTSMEWRTKPSKGVLAIMEGGEAFAFNGKFRVEIGNYLFQFINDDSLQLVVAAKHFSFLRKSVSYSQ